jgi:predicted MFS family arabinose efflux permease
MTPWNGLNKLPKEVWVVAIATLINRAGTVVLFFLTYYLRQPQLGFSLGRVGFIISLFGIGSLVTAPLSGWLSDRVGALQIMKLSLVLSGTVLLIYPLGESFLVIGLLTFLWAITSEAFRPASYAILTSVVTGQDEEETRQQSKSAQALYRLAVNVGFAIGPVFAGFLAARENWRALFLIDGLTSVLAFVYLSVTLRPAKFQNKQSDIHTTESVTIQGATSRAIEDRRLWYFLAAIAPALIVLFLELGPLPQFLKLRLGITESTFGYLISLNALLVILFELPLNWATGHWSYRRSLAWGAVLLSIGFGAVALVNSLPLIALTVVFWSFGEMFFLPNSIAYVGSIAPKARQGEYIGVYSMVFSLCMSVGPGLGIVALDQVRGEIMWGAAFILGGLSALMVLRLNRTVAPI